MAGDGLRVCQRYLRQAPERGGLFLDVSAWLTHSFYAATVSSVTPSDPVPRGTKFSFSKPMTRPDESFMRITSSPVSSQTCSSCGLPNHTVSVLPAGS